MISVQRRRRAAEYQEEYELELVYDEQSEQFLEVPLKKKVKKCNHQGGCVLCGENLDGCSVSHVGLAYETARLKSTHMDRLLCEKKLYLVLDLDFTLLHTTMLKELTPDEEYLKTQKQVKYLKCISIRWVTDPINLLDPRQDYLSGRIISRDDHATCIHRKHQKSLEVLQGLERAVVILDDTEEVWEPHKDNLYVMEKYKFFASSAHLYNRLKSLSQLKKLMKGSLTENWHVLFKYLNKSTTHFLRNLIALLPAQTPDSLLRSILKKILKRVAAMNEDSHVIR